MTKNRQKFLMMQRQGGNNNNIADNPATHIVD